MKRLTCPITMDTCTHLVMPARCRHFLAAVADQEKANDDVLLPEIPSVRLDQVKAIQHRLYEGW